MILFDHCTGNDLWRILTVLSIIEYIEGDEHHDFQTHQFSSKQKLVAKRFCHFLVTHPKI